MGQRIVQVNAFTNLPFAGNPAAVCVLPGPADARWMQNVAREMNLSETAFLYKVDDGFNLRWFTPTVEVDLCGHATLATSHALWEDGHLKPDEQARYQTRSGLLTADRRDGWISLDFPVTRVEETPAPPELARAIGVSLKNAGRTKFDWLVEVDSEATLKSLRPDFGQLGMLPIRGVIATSRASTSGYDFMSRFFAPSVGIDEDPVCGSAHCALGPYWAERLGKDDLMAYQASPRGGILRVRVEGPRVELMGEAVTVWRGELVGGANAA